MKTFFSSSLSGFFVEGIHELPFDAVEISTEEHAALLAAQAAGQQIVAGPGGVPVASDPPPPSPPTTDDLLARAAARRYERETAGTTLAGMPIRTDRDTRSALVEALAASDETDRIRAAEIEADGVADTPAWSTPWLLSNGTWVTVDGPLVRSIIATVSAWRTAAFATQQAAEASIRAGDLTTIADVDAAVWPQS